MSSALLAALLVVTASAVPARGPEAGAAPAATVVSRTQVDARTVDLVIDSSALGTTASVRLLLPARYAAEPTRTWPVLYLLHGCCEDADYRSWTQFTDVASFTATRDVLVVMPSDGRAGMYSSWWNFGLSATPDWEAFHTEELRQILERDYRAGTRRAVAGISIGGYGAMAYAFRKPGMFGAAASYSGLPNTLFPGVPVFIQGILTRESLNPLALWGHEVLSLRRWQERNPYDHIQALRGVALYVSCGTGATGPLDPPGQADALEPVALVSSRSFTDRLALAGIPVTVNYYGAGTHSWPYWERELHRSWPVLASALGLPA